MKRRQPKYPWPEIVGAIALIVSLLQILPAFAGKRWIPKISSAARTYQISEDWERSATLASNDWQKVNISSGAGVNFAATTNLIEGSQVLAVDATFASPSPDYAQNKTSGAFGFTNHVSTYAFFLARHSIMPSGDDFARDLFIMSDSGDNHLCEVDIHRVDATHFSIRIWSGVSGHTDTVATFGAAPVTNAYWVKYTVGSGANAVAEVWWTDASNLANLVKPTTGGNNYAVRSDGNYTTDVTGVKFMAELSGGNETRSTFDRCRVDNADIGSNPP